MTEYGTKSDDDTAYKLLLNTLAPDDILYIMHHPRVDMTARACKLPGSLKVQAVLKNKTVVTAFQPAPNKPARIL